VQVFWGEDHEFYVTPLSGGLTNVTLLAPLRQGRASRQQIWSRLLRAQPQLSGMLQNVQPAGPLRGAAAWNIRPSLRHLPGFLLHGDAAGYVDPITGGGMTQALLASRLFARGLRRAIPDDLQTLDQARQELLREYRLLTRAALWLAGRPLAAAASFRILKSWPGLFSMLLGMAGSAR
jgi:flavin-dependent dehydrogenase